MVFAAFGIAGVTSASLGTTPVSSVPVVFAKLTGFTFGTTTIAFNAVLVVGQIVLLKRVTAAILGQIPSLVIFGLLLDAAMATLSPLVPMVHASCASAWAMSLVGNVLLAVGIVLQVNSRTIVQSGEGIVIAVSMRLKKTFGSMKIANDISLVVIAVIMESAFLGTVSEVREGTLVSAVMVGIVVKAVQKRLSERARSGQKT